MSVSRILIFLAVFTTLIVLTHGYIWKRIFRDTGLGRAARRWGAALIVALGLLLVGGMVAQRALPRGAAAWVAWPAYVWMGLVILLVPLLAVTGVGGRIALWLRRTPRPDGVPDPQRRLALQRGTAAIAGLGALGAAGTGVASALGKPRLNELTIPVPRLPEAFRGLRIAQISDVHVGPTIGREFLADIVRRVNALEPDLVAITGDLVDGSVPDLAEHVAPLAGLRSRFGTFFVTGNHEYYSGADPWVAHLRSLGIRVLRNETFTLERGDARMDVVGTDDFRARDFGGGSGYDIDRAVQGRDPSRAALLLSHQPRCIDDAARHGLDVVLCGHTHGGQIWPFGYFVKLVQPYVLGLHQHTERTWIYVHPGTGWWGPPMRVNVPAEIALLTLV
jgi:predicted MPP superfamily phosphohydrolase